MVLGGCTMYVGASFGVLLFEYFPPAGVAWLRIAASAVIMLALVRPGRTAWQSRPMLLAGVFGLVTALMNICFYEAIARLPLGTAVAIEFLGPIAVVAAESRSLRALGSLLAALSGVVLIADVQFAAQPLGIAFALSAAAFWAGYVVLGKVVAQRGNSLESLAVGWAIAAVVTAPLLIGIVRGWGSPGAQERGWWTVVAMVGALAVFSSVIPYALDQVILRMVGRARFALLLALLPVSAVLVGFVALGQVPSPPELVGIALVVLALVVSDRDKDAASNPP
ncbi:MAG: EamA family transporter [Actinobacteria bacterium]|nr:EamA family transporter [Actinomycetota bacterium]